MILFTVSIDEYIHIMILFTVSIDEFHDVGPCHHGMARPRVADGGMASYMEGSCE